MARALRDAVRAFGDEPITFLGVNLVLSLVATAASLIAVVVPFAVLAAPVLALPLAACLRLAIIALEDGVPAWRTGVAELGRSAGKKLLVAAVQLGVLTLGLLNVAVATSMGGVLGVASALVAVYGALIVSLVAIALWPQLADPRRDMPLLDQVRLAVGLVLARPFQLVGLLAIIVIGGLASIQYIAPAVVLPAFILLSTAAFVAPSIDRLRPAGDG